MGHEGQAGEMGYVRIVADPVDGRSVCRARVEADVRMDGGVNVRVKAWDGGPEGRGVDGSARERGQA